MRLVFLLAPLALTSCQSADAPKVKPTPAPATAPAGARTFGAELTAAAVMPLSKVLSAPGEFANKTVTVEGQVRRNCTVKGCWMELATGLDKSLQGCRVTFKDYGFFVPLDSAGSVARVQGTVVTKDVAKGEVEHLEAEGATFENKRPDGSATEVRIVATGVELFKGS